MSVFEADDITIYDSIEQKLLEKLEACLPVDSSEPKIRINERIISIRYDFSGTIYLPENIGLSLRTLFPGHKVYIHNKTGSLTISSNTLNELPKQVCTSASNLHLNLRESVIDTTLTNVEQNYRIRVNLLSDEVQHILIDSNQIDVWKYVNTPGKQTPNLGEIKVCAENLGVVYENPSRFKLPERVGDLNIQYDVQPKIISVRNMYSSSLKYIE